MVIAIITFTLLQSSFYNYYVNFRSVLFITKTPGLDQKVKVVEIGELQYRRKIYIDINRGAVVENCIVLGVPIFQHCPRMI